MLLIAIGTMTTVQAMEVHIDVDAEGNITVTTSNEDNGTLTIIYNGVDLLSELNSQLETVNSQLITIMILQEQMKRFELNDLNQKILQLIEELNSVFKDVYGKVGFLAYVIGLNSNSSMIVENLKSGDSTIVNYLDEASADLDDTNLAISNVAKELADTYTEAKLAMQEQGIEIKNLEEFTNDLEEYLNKLEEYTEEQLSILDSSVLDETNRQTATEERQTVAEERLNYVEKQLNMFASLSICLVMALASLVIALVYVATKKPKKVEAKKL